MTLRPRTWVLGFVLLLLVGLFAVAYPFLTDPNYVKTLLLEEVQHEVGRTIEVGATRLELFPRIRLQLFDVVIRDVDPAREFFSARHIDIYLRVFSFLRKRVIVKQLAVDQPRIELRRDRSGRWNVLSDVELPSALPLPSDRGGRSPLSLLLLVREITLQNGEVRVIDESRQDGLRALSLGNVEVSMKSKTGGMPIDVAFSGTILDSPGTSRLILNGKLSQGTSPVRIAPADPTRLTHAFQFEGATDAAAVDIRKVAEFFGPLPVPEGVKGSASMHGRIAILPGVVGYDMVLSEMKLSVESLSVAGQASLAGLMSPQPTFSLTFSATPIDLDDLVQRIPPAWLHPQLRRVVKEQGIDGTVEIVSATVTGTAVPEPRVSVTGEVRVTKGRAYVGHDRTRVENLSGVVVIEPDRLKVTNLRGNYGAIEVKTGKATVSFIQPGPWLELEFTGDTSAAEVTAILARSAKPAAVRTMLKDIRDIKGTCQVTYHLAGALRESDGVEFLDGEFVFRETEFAGPWLQSRVTGFNGLLKIEPNQLKFERFSARVGKAHAEFNGAIVIGDTTSFDGVTILIKGEAAEVVRLVTVGAVQDSLMSGSLDVHAAVSGPVDAPSFRGSVDLKGAEVAIPGYFTKAVGKPASIEFDTSLRQGPAFAFKQVELVVPPLRLTGKGLIRMGTPFGLDITFLSGPIALASGLPEGFTLFKGLNNGTLEVSMDVKGRGSDWKGWSYNGWVALTDGVIAAKGFEHPIKEVYLRLKIDRQGGEIKRLAFTVQDSDVAVSGTVRNWTKLPVVNVKIESSDFDIDLVIPKGGRSPVRDLVEDVAASSRVTASVAIDRARYRSLQLESVSTRVALHDSALDLDRLSATVGSNGRISAHVVLNLPKNQPADGEVAFQIMDMPTTQFLQLIGDEKHVVIGDLTANGVLSADGADPNGTLASINGNLDFYVRKGRIQRGIVLPKLFTILHIGSVLQGKWDPGRDGIPFDRVTGSVGVQKGLVTLKTMVVDSPILKTSQAGTYNLGTDQLDVVLVASPLGPYAQALKNIPLFGKLFAGERRGIDTAIFEVKGSLSDPTIQYLPMKSLTTGLGGLAQFAFDVLKNVVLLPKALIPAADPGDVSTEPPSPTIP